MVIDSSFVGWATAFAITAVSETTVWLIVGRAARLEAPGRLAAAAIGVNIVTHPLLFAASTRMTSLAPLLVAEVAVVAVEAGLMMWWLRTHERLLVALTALLANLLSFGIGVALAVLA